MDELQEFERDGRVFRISVSEQHTWLWDHMKDNTFEPETFDLFKRVITADTLYIDIGSWVGPTVLYGGHLAKRAIGVEPIAVSMAAMIRNLELNGDIMDKVELFNVALAPEPTILRLYNQSFGDGMASILPNRGSLSMTFMAMGIDDFLDRVLGDEPHVFIKVDVEGAEFALVPKMCASLRRRNVKADLYVSLHGSFTKDARDTFPAYAGNLKKSGDLLNALAEYGEVMFADAESFSPIHGATGTHPNIAQLLVDGGIDTTVFVKAS